MRLDHIILPLVLLALGACTTLPADPVKMSPEQLREWAKDKGASVVCTSGKTAGGNVTIVTANLDKAAIYAGTVTVNPDCATTIVSEPKPVPAPRLAL